MRQANHSGLNVGTIHPRKIRWRAMTHACGTQTKSFCMATLAVQFRQLLDDFLDMAFDFDFWPNGSNFT